MNYLTISYKKLYQKVMHEEFKAIDNNKDLTSMGKIQVKKTFVRAVNNHLKIDVVRNVFTVMGKSNTTHKITYLNLVNILEYAQSKNYDFYNEVNLTISHEEVHNCLIMIKEKIANKQWDKISEKFRSYGSN